MEYMQSGQHSLDVYSLRFPGCAQIYHVTIFRKDKGWSRGEEGLIDSEAPMKELIRDVLDNCPGGIRFVIADAPKRFELRGQTNFNSYHGCENCFAVAQNQPTRPDDPNSTAFKRVWPYRTSVGHPKRRNELIRNDERLELPGMVRRSPLLADPHFDMVLGMPVEQMHTGPGLCKRMFEMCFTTTKTRKVPRTIRKVNPDKIQGANWNVVVSISF